MYFEVDGERTFAAGQIPPGHTGRVIVLIHGAAMDHSVWVYHTRYFMHEGAAVVAIDLPAHGRSEGEPLGTIEAMAAWLLRCLDALDIRHASLVGHSMGALVALQAAADAGARVERLVMLGAAVPMQVSPALLDSARENRAAARDMMMLWGHGARAHIGGNAVAGMSIVNSAMRLLERARPGLLHSDLNACNDYRQGLDAAARVSAKTRIVCGRDDKMTPTAVARTLAAAIAECDIEVIPACGHIMMSEQPEATHRQLVAALG